MARGELTISDLADRIAPGADLERQGWLAQRIKYWTTEGILRTIGSRSTGRGRYRQYSETAVYEAALLVELQKYGLPLNLMRSAVGMVSWGGEMIETAISGQQNIYLAVRLGDTFDGHDVAIADFLTLGGRENMLLGKRQSSQVVVNLTEVFRRVRP